MSASVHEVYNPKIANASTALLGSSGGVIGGFLCTVSGTLSLDYSTDGTGSKFVDTLPVTAGTFYPLPFAVQGAPVYATLGGGAKGTFALA